MKMTNLRMLAILLTIALHCGLAPVVIQAQLEVFPTLKEYTEGVPVRHPGFKPVPNRPIGNGKIMFHNPSTKQKLTVDCKEIWGLRYNGRLIRSMTKGPYFKNALILNGQPVLLSMDNGVQYWTLLHSMEETKDGKLTTTTTSTSLGSGLLTPSIDGEMLLIQSGPEFTKNFDAFIDDHPHLEWLRACLREKSNKKNYDVTEIESCILARSPAVGTE